MTSSFLRRVFDFNSSILLIIDNFSVQYGGAQRNTDICLTSTRSNSPTVSFFDKKCQHPAFKREAAVVCSLAVASEVVPICFGSGKRSDSILSSELYEHVETQGTQV
jgi:hypothetical protein